MLRNSLYNFLMLILGISLIFGYSSNGMTDFWPCVLHSVHEIANHKSIGYMSHSFFPFRCPRSICLRENQSNTLKHKAFLGVLHVIFWYNFDHITCLKYNQSLTLLVMKYLDTQTILDLPKYFIWNFRDRHCLSSVNLSVLFPTSIMSST